MLQQLGFYNLLYFFNLSLSNEWHIFSGNELGALLGWWMLHVYRVRYPGNDIGNAYMIASTVSSKILQSMAKKEGFQYEVGIKVQSFQFIFTLYSCTQHL